MNGATVADLAMLDTLSPEQRAAMARVYGTPSPDGVLRAYEDGYREGQADERAAHDANATERAGALARLRTRLETVQANLALDDDADMVAVFDALAESEELVNG